MKKILMILLILVVIPILAFAAGSHLTISWQFLDTKIRPGSDTTLILTLTNPSSTVSISYIKLYITPSSAITTEDTYFSLSGLNPLSSQQTAIKLKTAFDAPPTGEYVKVMATYYYEGSSEQQETTINIPIKITKEPILQIQNINYSKSMIEAGDSVLLDFDIVNKGDGKARDVRIILNQTQKIFTPLGSGENFIDEIEVNKAVNNQFALVIDPSAAIGVYSIPVSLNYYDETKNTTYSTTKFIGLVISGKYNFVVALESQDVIAPGTSGGANIKIANAGTQDAQFLTVKVKDSDVFKQITPQVVYVGSLDSNEYDTEKFNFKVSSSTSPNFYYPFTLQLEYTDSYGNPYKEIYNVNIKVSNPTELQKEQTFSPILIGIAILVIIVVAYIVYKKIRKK